MRAVVVYESMYGNTRLIAEAIADGLRPAADVRTACVLHIDENVLDGVDLVVVGGPTHAWSMSRPSTRSGASLNVHKPDSDLVLEPGADSGDGVREWLAKLEQVHARAAAFDTRINSPVLVTGRASKGISRQLSRAGMTVVAPPESFLVDKKSHLVPGEVERATAWGGRLATQVDRLGTLQR